MQASQFLPSLLPKWPVSQVKQYVKTLDTLFTSQRTVLLSDCLPVKP